MKWQTPRVVGVKAWTWFGTMSVLWGVSYLFIKIAVDDGLSPAFVAWSRVVIAAVVLIAIAGRARTRRAARGRRPTARRGRGARRARRSSA